LIESGQQLGQSFASVGRVPHEHESARDGADASIALRTAVVFSQSSAPAPSAIAGQKSRRPTDLRQALGRTVKVAMRRPFAGHAVHMIGSAAGAEPCQLSVLFY
jgi:hypothetical protein